MENPQKAVFFNKSGIEVNFGFKPRKQIEFIGRIPELRDFISTAVY